MARWVRFFIVLLIGIAAGLFYAWVINPVEYVNTTASSLRIDYKTDYVLMVAEAYRSEDNLAVAVQRLAFLGSPNPADLVHQAILFAQRAGYTDADLATMLRLSDALQTFTSNQGTRSP